MRSAERLAQVFDVGGRDVLSGGTWLALRDDGRVTGPTGMKPSQAQACNNCVQIPWGLTAVTVAYNLPGIKRLKLTPAIKYTLEQAQKQPAVGRHHP